MTNERRERMGIDEALELGFPESFFDAMGPEEREMAGEVERGVNWLYNKQDDGNKNE